jgi:hypothetical protein
MRYVIEQFWLWTVVALVLGLTAGWVAARQPVAGSSGRWIQAYVALAVIGWGIVYGGLVRATAGLWFESLVLLGTAYLAGCIVGSFAAPRGAVKDAIPAGNRPESGA